MKKIFAFITMTLMLFSLVTPVYANTIDDPLVIDLLAGQNEYAGDIKVWDDGSSLYVLYETVDPWCLMETQLAVASTLDGIPQSNGNPVPTSTVKNFHYYLYPFWPLH